MGFTDEQIQVINSRDKNLIVSAAAGSGKTAVLTERIVRRIVERTTSIDRMLIVTFTNAAAREMRDRIGKRLREELAKDPGDSYIRKQIAILHTAQITTIDSFCLFILKNHFEEIGIDPAFSIGNEGELKELQDEAFDDALEQAFKEAKPSFLNLVEMYAPKGKYDTLKDIVIKLATTVDSTPFPFDTLEKCIVKDIEDVWNLEFVHFIEDYENEFLDYALEKYNHVRELTFGSALSKHYDEACAEISFINSLIDSGYEFRSRAFLSHEKIKLLYGGKKFSEEELEIKHEADAYIKLAGYILDDLKKKYHYITPEQFEELTKEGYQVTNALIEFVLSYMKLFDSKKRDKCVISFSDMEHMALDNPTISFRYINNKDDKFSTSGNGDLLKTILNIYGVVVASKMIEIKGENITKYKCTPCNVYVKYGKHVGTYVDMKFFESPRLLVREIINPLMACYVEETYINDPGIINVIRKDNNNTYSFKMLWGILNSKMTTYFLLRFAPKASKGTFPKVLITDINKFPLPEYNDTSKAYYSKIEECYDKIFPEIGNPISDQTLLSSIEWEINYWVFKLYGIMSEDDINLISPGFFDLKPDAFIID